MAGRCQDNREGLLDEVLGRRLVLDQRNRVTQDAVLEFLDRRFERLSRLSFQVGPPQWIYERNGNLPTKLPTPAGFVETGGRASATCSRGSGGLGATI